jgi:hypothetical protein
MAMSSTTTKPDKFNEIFESANRLRTVRNAPNPFLVVRKSDGRLVERVDTSEGESAVEKRPQAVNNS